MRNIILITLLFIAKLSYAYNPANDSITMQKINLANKLLTSGGQEKAYKLYLECAEKGNAQAMNALGILLQRGWGIAKDEPSSIIWFEKASNAGYSHANMNLAQIYAKGLGTEQNFEKAVSYTEKLLNFEPRWANSRLGYYYYKGLGVEQNYEKSVHYFLVAAKNGSANAYYFLGLCYRNGYGVARNEGEAQYYLQKASEMGHYYSKQELSEDIPEIGASPQRLKAKSSSEDNNSVQKVNKKMIKQNITSEIEGEYEGTLTTYDYSGTRVVREVPLKIKFSNPNNLGVIAGDWLEADSIKATFEATLTDSTLQFLNTSYKRTDYYNKKQAIKWNFTKAKLEKTNIENNVSLSGIIQMFSPQAKEPEKPMYVSLMKKNSNSDIKNFTATPIIGSNDVNIGFNLDKKSECIINIFNISGVLVYSEKLGQLDSGTHRYIVALDIPKGQYVIQFQTNNIQTTRVIIKN
jgi:TPR repeat protein